MNISENVRQEVIKLIPSSLLNDIACFVFYDNHPKSGKNIDITVCTKTGEIREYCQRDLQSCLNLNRIVNKTSELRILRNNNSELFYLLASEDDLFIISSKEQLEIHKKLSDVDYYDINDVACSGEACLKVVKKYDAVPIVFDNNFQCLEDHDVFFHPQNIEDSSPILNELKRKLVEARYTTLSNEKIYAQYLSLHQKVSLLDYKNQQPIVNSSVFKDDVKSVSVLLRQYCDTVICLYSILHYSDDIIHLGYQLEYNKNCGVLKLKTHIPWVKVCNKKLLIMFNVLLHGKKSIDDVHILLNNSSTPSLVYTTKIFSKLPSPPYFREASGSSLKPEQEFVIAAVLDMEEVQQSVAKIDMNGSITYKVSGKEYLLPFEDVVVSSMEVMGDEFDVLSTCETDEQTIIAILAATEKTELCIRHIRNNDELDASMLDLFCTHLQMDRVENCSNVIVYKKSPYHALNGIMLIFHESNSDKVVPVSVHTRSQSQVLVLLHNIYDRIPARIIATTPSCKITAKTDFLQYSEELSNVNKQISYMDYATSMLNRTDRILDYLDKSIVKMNESKNPTVLRKVGSHIDLFAVGVEKYKEFRQSMLKEAEKGVDSLMTSELQQGGMESNVMYVD